MNNSTVFNIKFQLYFLGRYPLKNRWEPLGLPLCCYIWTFKYSIIFLYCSKSIRKKGFWRDFVLSFMHSISIGSPYSVIPLCLCPYFYKQEILHAHHDKCRKLKTWGQIKQRIILWAAWPFAGILEYVSDCFSRN